MSPNGTHEVKETRRIESGDYVTLGYVPPFLIERMQRSIADPEVPIYETEDGEKLENPTDPVYLASLKAVEAERTQAAMLAAVIYGMNLTDETGETVTPEEGWEEVAKWLLNEPDFNPYRPVDFLPEPKDPKLRAKAYTASYLLYHGLGVKDMRLISEILGQPAEDYERAMSTFRG